MNNSKLLAGLLCVVLSGSGARSYGQQVITLDEIYRVAETNSSQLLTSYASEQESERDVSAQRTNCLLDIKVNLTAGYNGNGFTTKRNFSDYQKAPIPHLGNALGVTVSQPIYTGGAITNTIKLAELKSIASRFATDLKRDNLRFRLTGYYLDISKNRNLRKVVESNLTAAKRVLEDMKVRHSQGIVLLNDITRYELLVSNLELEIVRIDNNITILNDNLVTLSGLPSGTIVLPDTTLLTTAISVHDADTWQHEATAISPRLKLAQSYVDISRKSEDLVRSELLPKIGLEAGWSINGPILTEVPPINRNLSYWYVGLGISYNLASLYKSNKSLARSKAATTVAENLLASTKEDVALDISDAFIHWKESLAELKTYDKGVELAMRNYRTVETRYGAGMALITDLLDAASSRLDAEQRLENARINIIYNYYRLLFSTGKI